MRRLAPATAVRLFRAVLGLVVLIESVRTALHAAGLHGGALRPHLLLLASVEALGAVLFLVPATLVAGGLTMLATFAIAFAFHALHGEPPLTLLVYAAGTLLVLTRPAENRAADRV